MASNSSAPNSFADEPQSPGTIRLQSAADPLDPYAAPAGAAEYFESLGPGVGLWRVEHELVMHRHAAFPPRCVLTNDPHAELVHRRVAWNHPFDLDLLGRLVVPYAILPSAARGLGYKRILSACIALAALATVAYCVSIFSLPFVFLIIPIGILSVVFFECSKIAWGAACPLRIVARGGDYFWIIGVGPEFLASLPAWPRQKKHQSP
jgi:hypothetical protein